MAEIVFILLFAFPAILGLAEILHSARMWLIASKRCGKKLFVVVPDNEDFIRQIMGAYEELKWQGSRLAHKVIIVDTLLSEENKKECNRLALKYGLEICSRWELSQLVAREAE